MLKTMANKNYLNFMNSIQVKTPKKSVFDLTHDVKLSGNMGFLIPSMVFDVVPGDMVQISNDALIRFAPLISPMYHRCYASFHTYAVPYRILWPNWEDYITETKQAGVLPACPFIKVKADGTNYTPLMDYLGIPSPLLNLGTTDEEISAFRFAAYQMVYNELYRDENLIPEVEFLLDDGDNSSNVDLTKLRKRAWMHDYFTSNLPFAQKGDPVDLPISITDANVYRKADPATGTPAGQPVSMVNVPNVSFPLSGNELDIENRWNADPTLAAEGLYADNSTARGTTTINDLRLAEALQKYLERAARSGTRLVEWIKGMFGETLPDYTAQRPQYIGGSHTPVQISEILQTGESGTTPQGNMAGRGVAAAVSPLGKYHAREHCVIITLMSIMPETTYQQGIEREYAKTKDPKDFLNPLFAHLGEQETLTREIFAFQSTTSQTFGYLPRFSEYRTIPSRVAGDFRDTLSYWTMSRIFDPVAGAPGLTQDFIECDATHRVFADTDPDDQKLYVHVTNRVRAVRPLPKFGTPSL